jgi:hypothetical protein
MNSKKHVVNGSNINKNSPSKVHNFQSPQKEQTSLEKLYFKLHSPEFARIISHTNNLRKQHLELIKKPVKKYELPNNMEAFNLKVIIRKYETNKASHLNRSQKREMQLKKAYSQIPSAINNELRQNDEIFLNDQLRNISDKSQGGKLSEDLNHLLKNKRDSSSIQTLESTTKVNSKLTRRNSVSVNYSQSDIKNLNIFSNGNRVSLFAKDSFVGNYGKKLPMLSHHNRERSIETEKSDAKQILIEELDQDIFRLTSDDLNPEKDISTNLKYILNKNQKKIKNKSNINESKRNLIDEMKNELVSIAKNSIALPPLDKERSSKILIVSPQEDSQRKKKKDDKDEVTQVKMKFHKKYTDLVKDIETQKAIHKSRNVFKDNEIDFIVSSNSQTEIEMLKNSFKSQYEKAVISKKSRKEPSQKKRMNLLSVSNASPINNLNFNIDSLLKNKLIGEMSNIHKRTLTKQKLICALERKAEEYNIFQDY